MQLYVLGRQLTLDEVEQFLKDFYPYAYTVAKEYAKSSIYLSDDVRENIAWNALERALKTYDTTKGASFKTYLTLLIQNDLKSEIEKMQRRPLSVRDVVDVETGEQKDIFDFIADSKELKETNLSQYNELMRSLEKQLSSRQKQLLDMLMAPEVYVQKYNEIYKPEKKANRLNYEMIGQMLGISVASVTYELKKIQTALKNVLQKMDLNVESNDKKRGK